MFMLTLIWVLDVGIGGESNTARPYRTFSEALSRVLMLTDEALPVSQESARTR